jgi:N-acetyltransferase
MPFSFNKDYTIQNDEVKLRPLKPEDCDNLMVFSIFEADIWEYSLAQASGKENLAVYIKKVIQKRSDENSYPFIVFDKRKNKYC